MYKFFLLVELSLLLKILFIPWWLGFVAQNIYVNIKFWQFKVILFICFSCQIKFAICNNSFHSIISDMLTQSSHFLSVSRQLRPLRLSSSSSKFDLILRSTSNNIYRNLALEDWFFQNHTFKSSKILYFYRNTPCVVIGRHQNPWLEANVPFLRKHSIDLGETSTSAQYLQQFLFSSP